MGNDVDSVLTLIWKQFGSPWLFAALVAAWVLRETGLIGVIFGVREKREERFSEERAEFINALTKELMETRLRHATDIQDLERRLEDAHRRADEERTNAARWRHLLGNMGQYIMRIRFLLEKAGVDPPRFDWSRFTEEGGDPEEFRGLW